MNEYICLNCQTEQPKPANPLGWCLYCYSTEVTLIELKKNSGWVIIEELDDKTIRLGYQSVELLTEISGVIQYFYCDDLKTAYKLLDHALCNVCIDGFFGNYTITQEQSEYIKSIEKFENGRFYFKGEDNNG
jgi:uncharacterized linocin/CFP29 family protein